MLAQLAQLVQLAKLVQLAQFHKLILSCIKKLAAKSNMVCSDKTILIS